HWENMRQYAFEAALSNTDAVIQPRQSNTWGGTVGDDRRDDGECPQGHVEGLCGTVVRCGEAAYGACAGPRRSLLRHGL
ncbi:MAG: hypothetical protein J6X35_01085, partial [Bacteroidales bacterium]|nr:hypothetical protein [Bacteroidales bacterium]